MQAAVRSADRVIVALGTGLSALSAQVVEDLEDPVFAQIAALLPTVVGDGAITLSADHTAVALVPPSAGWVAAQQAAAAATGLLAQHRVALAGVRSTLLGNSAQTAADLAALQTIATALATGVQPTAAQQTIIDRVYLRLIILALNG